MPHLSPMDWVVIMTVNLFILVVLTSFMWWHLPLTNKPSTKSTSKPKLSWTWTSK